MKEYQYVWRFMTLKLVLIEEKVVIENENYIEKRVMKSG